MLSETYENGKENYKLVLLINMEIKILFKALVRKNKQQMEKITRDDQISQMQY